MNADSTDRSFEDLHRDISLANQYRLEFIKHALSLAAAVFVFTVTFVKDIVGEFRLAVHPWLIGFGWGAMVVSLLGGLGHLAGWDRYYISYRRDYQFARYGRGTAEGGRHARKTITLARRFAMWAQLLGFAVGLIAIAWFSYVNLRSRGAH